MRFTNTVYDKMKWFVQIFLPAGAAMYFGLDQLWHVPYPVQVMGTINLMAVFLGTLLGISTKNYNADGGDYDGSLQVEYKDDGTPRYSFVLNTDASKWTEKTEVKLQVEAQPKHIVQ